MDINNYVVQGNLTRDPESRQAGNSTLVNFGIANNRSWLKSGTGRDTGIDPEWQEETTFWEVTVWKSSIQDQILNDLSKGSPVTLMCRVQENTWQDKDTGANRSRHELVVSDASHTVIPVNRFTPKSELNGSGGAQTPSAPPAGFASEDPNW